VLQRTRKRRRTGLFSRVEDRPGPQFAGSNPVGARFKRNRVKSAVFFISGTRLRHISVTWRAFVIALPARAWAL
jgi:hypothetical protein